MFRDGVKLVMSRAEYAGLPDKEQNALKNVTCVVPSIHKTNPSPRTADTVIGYSLVALDIECKGDPEKHRENVQRIISEISLMPYAHISYYTARSTPESPRLRVLVFSSEWKKTAKSPSYREAVEYIAAYLKVGESLDPCSYKDTQPMFAPLSFVGDSPQQHLVSYDDTMPLFDPSILSTPLENPEAPEQGDDDDISHLPDPAITLEDAEEMLSYIDPDMGRPEWAQIIAALKHQFGYKSTQTQALDLLHRWSKGDLTGDPCPRYDAAATNATWRSLSQYPKVIGQIPVTIRTVMSQAKSKGYDATDTTAKSANAVIDKLTNLSISTEKRIKLALKYLANSIHSDVIFEAKLTNMIVAMSKECGAKMTQTKIVSEVARLRKASIVETFENAENIPTAFRGWVYVAAADKFQLYADNVDSYKLSKMAFDTLHASTMTSIDLEGTPASVFLLGAEKPKIPAVVGEVCDFSRTEDLIVNVGDGDFQAVNVKFNTFPPHSDNPELLERADTTFQKILGAYKDEKEREVILSWLAWVVQNPADRASWAIMFKSHVQGSGKTFWYEVLRSAVGDSNAVSVPRKVRSQNHNSFLNGTKCVCYDELHEGTTADQKMFYQDMKEQITSDHIMISEKYLVSTQRKITCSFILCSNHDFAMEKDDRRIAVFEPRFQNVAECIEYGLNSEFWEKAFEFIRHYRHAVRGYFLSYKIPSWFDAKGHAYYTPAKARMLNNCVSEVQTVIQDVIDSGEYWQVTPTAICQSILTGVLKDRGVRTGLKIVQTTLREMGMVMHEKRQRIDNTDNKHTVWTLAENLNKKPKDLFEVVEDEPF